MAGITVSFVADPKLAARVKDIARSDGVTPSQAAARASALGALLPPAARRTFRFVLSEGDEEAQRQLVALMTKSLAQVGNAVIERQLLAQAQQPAPESDDEIAALAVKAVADYRRQRAGAAEQHVEPDAPGQKRR